MNLQVGPRPPIPAPRVPSSIEDDEDIEVDDISHRAAHSDSDHHEDIAGFGRWSENRLSKSRYLIAWARGDQATEVKRLYLAPAQGQFGLNVPQTIFDRDPVLGLEIAMRINKNGLFPKYPDWIAERKICYPRGFPDATSIREALSQVIAMANTVERYLSPPLSGNTPMTVDEVALPIPAIAEPVATAEADAPKDIEMEKIETINDTLSNLVQAASLDVIRRLTVTEAIEVGVVRGGIDVDRLWVSSPYQPTTCINWTVHKELSPSGDLRGHHILSQYCGHLPARGDNDIVKRAEWELGRANSNIHSRDYRILWDNVTNSFRLVWPQALSLARWGIPMPVAYVRLKVSQSDKGGYLTDATIVSSTDSVTVDTIAGPSDVISLGNGIEQIAQNATPVLSRIIEELSDHEATISENFGTIHIQTFVLRVAIGWHKNEIETGEAVSMIQQMPGLNVKGLSDDNRAIAYLQTIIDHISVPDYQELANAPLNIWLDKSVFMKVLMAISFTSTGLVSYHDAGKNMLVSANANLLWENHDYILPVRYRAPRAGDDPEDILMNQVILEEDKGTKEHKLYLMLTTVILWLVSSMQMVSRVDLSEDEAIEWACRSIAWAGGMSCEALYGFYRRSLVELYQNPPSIINSIGRLARITPAIVSGWDRARCQLNIIPRFLMPISFKNITAEAYRGAHYQATLSFKAVQMELYQLILSAATAPSVWSIVDAKYQLKMAARKPARSSVRRISATISAASAPSPPASVGVAKPP